MSCSDAMAELSAYICGDMDFPHTGHVRDHLEVCGACRERVAAVTSLMATIRSGLLDCGAAPDLTARVMSALLELPAI